MPDPTPAPHLPSMPHPIIQYHCFEMIPKMVKIMNGYLSMDRENLTNELKTTFHHADSQVHRYTRFYLAPLCKDQINRGNGCLNTVILAYTNISHNKIDKGALSAHSDLEIELDDLTMEVSAETLKKLKQDLGDPSTCTYDLL